MTYPRPLQALHWTVATLVTCQLAIAVVLSQLRSLAYGQHVLSLHRQLGLVILLLVVARFVVARRHRPPSPTSELPSWQMRAAVIVHRLFFVLLIVQPVLGIMLAWARGDGVSLFGLPDIPAPWEIFDTARERFMTLHAAVALLLFGLCVLHIGAVVFNRVVRRVSVIDRMLPPSAADRLVNRVPVAAQLTLAFGLVVIMALVMGINAAATYRQFNKVSAEFQEGEVTAWDNTRSAQVAWKELLGLAAAGHASENSERMQELADGTRSSIGEALAHTGAGETQGSLQQLTQQLAGIDAAAPADIEKLREIDTRLQDLVDSQAAAAFQHRTENDEQSAQGQDLIVVTVLPMMLAGIIAALLLARSVTGSLSRMSTLIRGIESERRADDISVVGDGEFAALTREIVSMRVAVEQRSRAAAEQRATFDAERVQFAEEQQQREVAAERQGRVERQMQRERMAGEFELQVAVIVDTVARTAQELTSAAGSMAASASNTTQRSRDASSIADKTSGTASLISQGTQDLSNTARSVRENAEKSQARAVLAVQEAAAAREQIDHLLAAAKQIGSITDVIAGVARQTNLLAINARIEAARAGEVGRGFSVVANEVKDLANQTRNATHGIGKQIEEVTTAAARSSQSLERLREVIQGLEEAAAAIFTSTAQQFASTRDIAERVAEISSSTRSVAQNIHDARNTASDTEALSEQVARAAAVVDEQALDLREQVAGFVLQLRENATVPAQSAPRRAEPDDPEAARSRAASG